MAHAGSRPYTAAAVVVEGSIVEFREVVAIARAWAVVIFATTLLAAVAAFVASTILPKTYEASTTILIGPPLSSAGIGITDLTIADDLAATYAQVATSRPVLDAVAGSVGVSNTNDELANTVTARTPANTAFVIITADADNPQTAASIANDVAGELVKLGPSAADQTAITSAYRANLASVTNEITSVESQLQTLQALARPTADQITLMTNLQTQLTALQSTRATIINSAPSPDANVLNVIESAEPPTAPSGPSRLLNIAFGGAIGFAISLLAAFLVENARRAGLLSPPEPTPAPPGRAPAGS